MRIAVIGGGAAGYFFAINCKLHRPDAEVAIYEASGKVLQKVLVSGGGRCNVTHACFDATELTAHYPRGSKELLPAFHRFNPAHTIQWFEERGVKLKREADGRMFPVSNDSRTIVSLFQHEAAKLGVKLHLHHAMKELKPLHGNWLLTFANGHTVEADRVMIASGSSKAVWKLLERLGHRIVPPVPSLFTFSVRDKLIEGLAGVSCTGAIVRCPDLKLEAQGPLLITHPGLSGPAVLRLSAWGAREMNRFNYRFEARVNFCALHAEAVTKALNNARQMHPSRKLFTNSLFSIPLRLWQRLVGAAGIAASKNLADLTKHEMMRLCECLCNYPLMVDGKNTFKDEFVTAGGVSLREVNFKNMESKLFSGLYFAGEALDIDGITGGFNFQSAWTTAWIAATGIAAASD